MAGDLRSMPAPPPDWRPLVSVVVPVRNEAGAIEACLHRLLVQDYPSDRTEILVVDGCSDDGTRGTVERVRARHAEAELRLLDNPRLTVAPALNVGIRAARGDVIVRMDAHAVPSADYLSACVAALHRSGAANVGGVVVARGATPYGEAVAIATGHPLGAGDARYRIGGAVADVDTVPYGAFRREAFEHVGLFDESLVRNQDYEFNIRLRAAGGRILFDPAIRFTYTPRGDVAALWSQYFQYGWWKVETLRRHPHSLRIRQLLPPAAMAGGLATTIAVPFWTVAQVAFVVGLVTYFVTVGSVSLRIARAPASPLRVVSAFVVLHVGWALGFLANAASWGRYPYRARPPSVPRIEGAEPPSPCADASPATHVGGYHRDRSTRTRRAERSGR